MNTMGSSAAGAHESSTAHMYGRIKVAQLPTVAGLKLLWRTLVPSK